MFSTGGHTLLDRMAKVSGGMPPLIFTFNHHLLQGLLGWFVASVPKVLYSPALQTLFCVHLHYMWNLGLSYALVYFDIPRFNSSNTCYA